MTKKTRNKRVVSKIKRSSIDENAKNKQIPVALNNLPGRKLVAKEQARDVDFAAKYKYIADDLRRILLIAVPMLLAIIILSFFIN